MDEMNYSEETKWIEVQLLNFNKLREAWDERQNNRKESERILFPIPFDTFLQLYATSRKPSNASET